LVQFYEQAGQPGPDLVLVYFLRHAVNGYVLEESVARGDREFLSAQLEVDLPERQVYGVGEILVLIEPGQVPPRFEILQVPHQLVERIPPGEPDGVYAGLLVKIEELVVYRYI